MGFGLAWLRIPVQVGQQLRPAEIAETTSVSIALFTRIHNICYAFFGLVLFFQMVLYVVVEFEKEGGAVGVVPEIWIEKDDQVCARL